MAFVAALVDLFVVGRFDREVFADAGDDVGLQEVVDDDVREWRGLGVFVGQRFAESAGGVLVEVEFRGQGDGECLRVGLHCRSDDFFGFQGWADRAGAWRGAAVCSLNTGASRLPCRPWPAECPLLKRDAALLRHVSGCHKRVILPLLVFSAPCPTPLS